MGTLHSLRQARQIRNVFESVRPRLEDVESFFSRELDAAPAMVREVLGYVLNSGGKRVRPSLVLLIARMLGYSGERDIRYGAVVELIHTATLIHDDIIDESDLRRGRPTANQRYGNQATVLVGDWIYTRSMDLCLELGDVDVMRRLIHATLQMTEGEILADEIRARLDITEETYMDITRRKTAELFAAACAVPALFQPSTLHLTEPLLEYGRALGLCFQLVDDLLDFTASRDELGKPVLADLREGRVTLPIILLRPRLDSRRRAQLEGVLSTGTFDGMDAGELLDLVRSSGVLDEVRERASEYAERAGRLTNELPKSVERDALASAAELLLERSS